MEVHAYKVGDFSHTHERVAFRKLCERLAENPSNEHIFLIANATLPEVKHRPHSPKSQRTRNFKGVSPDIVVFKKDAIAVIEIKSHPGLITFPIERENMWDPWTYENDGIRKIINEGNPSPLSQVDTNSKAVQAFLENYENKFADGKSKDSLWYKLQKIILFSAPNVRFASHPPSFWRRTSVAVISSELSAEYDISKYLSDLTTGPIDYKKDPRPQIHLTENSIKTIADLLGAKEFNFISQMEAENSAIFPDYGLAPIISLGTKLVPMQESEDTPPKAPDTLLSEPVPLRVLRYYIDCFHELAKQESGINLSRAGNHYFLQNCEETVFFGDGQIQLKSKDIPERFLVHDARIAYGFLLLIPRREFKKSANWQAIPLFIRDMRIVREGSQYFAQSLSNDQVTVNRAALKSLRATNELSPEELEHLLMEVENAGSIEQQIRFLLDAVGLEWKSTYKKMGKYDPSMLNEGLLPLGILFQSSSDIYNRLLKELNKMLEVWKTQPNSRDNLAWKILDGLPLESLSKSWKPAPLCVLPSNYEQSQAVGLAIEGNSILQVISGPPGTGKTQVIQNIIVNAGHTGKKVIFSSKNNKAVDVVVDRMNGGIVSFPFVFRTGNNQQNKTFATFLKELESWDLDKFLKLKIEEQSIRSELRQLRGELGQLYHVVEQVRDAKKTIEKVDQQIAAICENNEQLSLLTNWYQKQSSDFGASIWRELANNYERELMNGANPLSRMLISIRKKFGVTAMMDRVYYEKLLRQKYSRLLEQRLPNVLTKAVGRENLVSATTKVLPLLEELIQLSQKYCQAIEIVRKYDEEKLLNKWTEIEKARIDSSKKYLELDWNRRRDDTIIREVTNLLENWNSGTPFNYVLKMFPCCATTTLSAGNKIPLSSELFDIAVIDEASQADIASCLPILYRAKRAIVIGDEMQLRPINTLSEDKNEQLRKFYDLAGEDYQKYDISTSILDIAYDRFTYAGGIRLLLRDHYRCHPNIIGFSNRFFYNSCLRIKSGVRQDQGIFLHPNNGEAKPRWRNIKEIDMVEQLVSKMINNGYTHSQIGVVTPFRQQAEAIIRRLRSKKLFEGESEKIIVSTAHGFQGDERDVMIFSLVIAKNMPPASINWVHDIASNSKNLLNVALTRARKELHIVADEELCTKTGGLLGALMVHCRNCAGS